MIDKLAARKIFVRMCKEGSEAYISRVQTAAPEPLTYLVDTLAKQLLPTNTKDGRLVGYAAYEILSTEDSAQLPDVTSDEATRVLGMVRSMAGDRLTKYIFDISQRSFDSGIILYATSLPEDRFNGNINEAKALVYAVFHLFKAKDYVPRF